MSAEKIDGRFDKLLDSLKEFDDKMDKLRRFKNFLVSAIEEAWKRSGQMNLIEHVDLVVRMPIGAVNPMFVEVSFNKHILLNLGSYQRLPLRVRLLDDGNNELTEGGITLLGLQFLMMNPSPAIDAAAKFCEGLGCLETFKGRIGRFCLMEYKF